MLWRWSDGTGCIRREKEKTPYLLTALGDAKGPIVAASDYMKSLPDSLSPVAAVAAGYAGDGWVWTKR